jgi:ketosteroid isomerase-like protein
MVQGENRESDGDTDRESDGDTDRESVLAWVSAWGDEVARADIRAGRERFATDMTAFGTHADVVVGRDAVEAQQWSQIWPAIEDFAFLVDLATVELSPDRLLAVVAVPWRSTGIAQDGARFERPGRASVVLRRATRGEPWIGIHTHFSLARGVPAGTFGRRTVLR